MSMTMQEYQTLDGAYKFFNKKLFASTLPECLIVMQRKGKRNLGYFHPNRFTHRFEKNKHTDEIALNPDNFLGQSDADILSVLAHEMVHLWQQHFDKPPRGGYHDKRWGRKMEQIGLMPSNTGKPGGKRTGQQMMHHVIPEGPFDRACKEFLASGKKLHWNSFPISNPKKPQSKKKFSCPDCGQNAWAKPTAKLICGNCDVSMLAE
jgi:ribosomal protein S27AE